MKLEYRIVLRFLAGGDFFEGVRAAIVDKDGAPRWTPSEIGDVPESAVGHFFAPLGRDELELDA